MEVTETSTARSSLSHLCKGWWVHNELSIFVLNSKGRLLGPGSISWLVEYLMGLLDAQINFLFASYVPALFDGIPRNLRLPIYDYGVDGCFRYFQLQLQQLLEYPAIDTEVFHTLQQIGNVIIFLFMLDTTIVMRDVDNFMQSAPFLVRL